ncbi:MAG TPA: serine protease [Pyrinomonadaceae bacterium]|jgi:S1-C subfamily serine protease|nr:serine protease [Pyrinomonadaceae bacterium]
MKGVTKVHHILILLAALLILRPSVFAQSCQKIYNDNRQSVVSIYVQKTTKSTGAVVELNGTGFIVSEDGYVLTANHVVAQGSSEDEVKVWGSLGSLYETKLQMRVVEQIPNRDIALLQFLNTTTRYKPVIMANPSTVEEGRKLCSIGFSARLSLDYHVNDGTLSARSGQQNNWWTTQMPSNYGESGAPVFDVDTEGAVAIKHGGYDDQNIGQNVNFLIPMNLARSLLLDFNIIVPTNAVQTPPPSTPSFPLRFTQDDNFGSFHMTTRLIISSTGRVDAITETNNHIALKGNCGKVAVWLLDKNGNVLTAQGDQRFCVSGKGVFWAKLIPVRTDTWSFTVSPGVLKQVANVSIFQTEDDTNPSSVTSENIEAVKQRLKSTINAQ